jgi:virulence factor
MLRIVFVGAGYWSDAVHGPALSHYAKEHPGEIELAALCVRRNVERAEQFCRRFGFQRVYTSLSEMLDKEKPDACWVVTPITATREVVAQVLERGVPVLFEKPPGANLKEAAELAEISRRTGTPNMVGFNRRWAPCTRQALEWAREHGPFEYIYARMLRPDRMDEEFAFGTGIHLLDCVRALAEAAVEGLKSARTARGKSASGVFNFHVDMAFESGATGRCDILPASGMLDETYTAFGAKKAISFTLPWKAHPRPDLDGKAELCLEGEGGEAKTYPIEPQFISSGFYGEAEEFISALKEGRRPSPSAEEAVDSVALAEAVQEGRDIEFG